MTGAAQSLAEQWRTLSLLRWWNMRGWARRTLRLTRNPRYAVGLLGAVAYFFWFVGRPMMGSGSMHTLNLGVSVSEGVHLAAAAVVGLYVCLSWLLSRGNPTIKLKGADFHLLMPAPIPRRTLLSYALLQQLPKLILVALILGFIMSSAASLPARIRHTGALMLLFVLWDMYGKSRGIFKHRLAQRSPMLVLLSQGAAAVVAAGIVASMRTGIQEFMHAAQNGDLGSREFWTRMSDTLPGVVTHSPFAWALKPFTFLTAARMSPDMSQALVSFAGGVALTAVLFLLLVWSNPGFNESQVVSAANRTRGSRREDRLRHHSPRMRRAQLFTLAPTGLPETALWWKHALSTFRFRLSWIVLSAAGVMAAAMVAVVWTGANRTLTGSLMGTSLLMGCILPFFSGISGNSGFVRDLKHLESVRTWPVPPRRMALGQAMHSALLGLGISLLLFLLALVTHFTARLMGRDPSANTPLPNGFLESFGADPTLVLAVLIVSALPALAGIAFLSSQLEGVTGLFLPGWLMMGDRRRGDPAAFGTRIIYGFAFFFALGFAVIPTGLLILGLVFLVHGGWTPPLGIYPLLGLVLGAPLLVEAGVMTLLGGRLWRGLDPSQEVLEGFD